MLGRKHRESGFTLIEVMIAVAIVGTATAIAVPNYLEWNARYQL
ncbi:MAG: Tfp pilus assembly protein FimT/FimU, partial [Nitrospirales bacterium]